MNNNPWFARIREGLFKDPSGKHRAQMGEAIWVYGYLHICASWKTGQFNHTYKSISSGTGIPESTVRKMIEKLKTPPPGELEGYIKVRQLSRGLHIQITKWDPPEDNKRAPKSGQSENGEGAQIRENGCPSMERVPKSGHPLNNGNIEEKSPRVPKSGQSYKTLNKTQKKEESLSLSKSSSKKPKAAKKTNPEIKVAIDHYHDEFLRIHGFKPAINGAAGKTFQNLLGDGGRSLIEIKELTTAYLSQPNAKLIEAGFPVEWLPGNINGLLLKKKQPEPPQEETEEERLEREDRMKRGYENSFHAKIDREFEEGRK